MTNNRTDRADPSKAVDPKSSGFVERQEMPDEIFAQTEHSDDRGYWYKENNGFHPYLRKDLCVSKEEIKKMLARWKNQPMCPEFFFKDAKDLLNGETENG